ncbi:MAG: S4 domain-containing protein, partial [Bacteroidota bacterium]
MRIDKYLWCIRYFKTRNQATEACKKGQIRINEVIAKAGKEVADARALSDELLLLLNNETARKAMADQ